MAPSRNQKLSKVELEERLIKAFRGILKMSIFSVGNYSRDANYWAIYRQTKRGSIAVYFSASEAIAIRQIQDLLNEKIRPVKLTKDEFNGFIIDVVRAWKARRSWRKVVTEFLAKKLHKDCFEYVVPVENLSIGYWNKNRKGIFEIDNVVFVDKSKLTALGKKTVHRFDLKKVARLSSGNFLNYETFAYTKVVSNDLDSGYYEAMQKIKNAIYMISSSELDMHKRGDFRKIGPYSLFNREATIYREAVSLSKDNQYQHGNSFVTEPLVLDISQKTLFKRLDSFFIYLPKLNKKKYFWLRRSIILAGKSIHADSMEDAFLYLFTAVENITKVGGTGSDIDRINGTLDSLFNVTHTLFHKKEASFMEDVYRVRCDIVHQGKHGEVLAEHLFFLDWILRNVLRIICRLDYINNLLHLRQHIELLNASRLLHRPFPHMRKCKGIIYSLPYDLKADHYKSLLRAYNIHI